MAAVMKVVKIMEAVYVNRAALKNNRNEACHKYVQSHPGR